jgi:hypothetical protein
MVVELGCMREAWCGRNNTSKVGWDGKFSNQSGREDKTTKDEGRRMSDEGIRMNKDEERRTKDE